MNKSVYGFDALGEVKLLEVIGDLLPHGSGINGNWVGSFHYLKEKRQPGEIGITFSNTFEAMNEAGMYCHDYAFDVDFVFDVDSGILSFDGISIHGRQLICCGSGLRDYLDELFSGWCDEVDIRGEVAASRTAAAAAALSGILDHGGKK